MILGSANIALVFFKKSVTYASRRPPHVQAGLKGFACTTPKAIYSKETYSPGYPTRACDFSLGGPGAHRRRRYVRINVAKLPEVTTARGQPGLPEGWGVKNNQQEGGKRGQETASHSYNDF